METVVLNNTEYDVLVEEEARLIRLVFYDIDDDDGYPAHSHHDKIPPWWGNVSND